MANKPRMLDLIVSTSPSPPQNDANAFIMPWCKNDAVASTKLTPNNMTMCINVIRRFYIIYLGYLLMFTMIAEFSCQGLEQKTTMDAFGGTFTCISHSSRSRGIFLARHHWSFWTTQNLRFKREITRTTDNVLHRMPVEQLAIVTGKVWGKKFPWVGFAAFPEPLGEGKEWSSSYYVQ